MCTIQHHDVCNYCRRGLQPIAQRYRYTRIRRKQVLVMNGAARLTSKGCVDSVSASKNGVLDHAITFVVNILFDEKSSQRELLLLRTLFLPIARITLIPRDRPILASIIDLDELFRVRSSLFLGFGKWREAFRLHEETSSDCIRVSVNVRSEGNISTLPRTADILFSVKMIGSNRWVIRSCNVVYDENTNTRSPVTLVS
jgi:hypothetical protein